jgi:hypothetical protein
MGIRIAVVSREAVSIANPPAGSIGLPRRHNDDAGRT